MPHKSLEMILQGIGLHLQVSTLILRKSIMPKSSELMQLHDGYPESQSYSILKENILDVWRLF